MQEILQCLIISQHFLSVLPIKSFSTSFSNQTNPSFYNIGFNFYTKFIFSIILISANTRFIMNDIPRSKHCMIITLVLVRTHRDRVNRWPMVLAKEVLLLVLDERVCRSLSVYNGGWSLPRLTCHGAGKSAFSMTEVPSQYYALSNSMRLCSSTIRRGINFHIRQ